MTDTAKSKFAIVRDGGATEVNRRPNLTGEFKLAGEEASTTLAYWGGKSPKTGRFYARGKATPSSIIASMTADVANDAPAPKGIDLKVGESVLFENPKATPENKQPHVYGYARRAEGFVRLAGWDRGGAITGTAEPYRPQANEPEVPAGEQHNAG